MLVERRAGAPTRSDSMKLISWGISDVGRKRDHNEDAFVNRPNEGLFIVADGMGGHLGGDRASRMAVDLVARELEHILGRGRPPARTWPAPGQPEEAPPAAALRAAARAAGAAIYEVAQSDAQLQGMGTTLTALLFRSGRAHVAHVGDSRAYLFRDGRVEQITEDHSWIAEQVKAGLLSEEEARDSKFKHIITRSVGFERDVQVDITAFPVLVGDCYLVCSDGLSNYIDGDELGRLMTAHFYSRVPEILVSLANERGGDDNITVLVVYAANDRT
jgi:serine/threonine protein phosphatase PrpC